MSESIEDLASAIRELAAALAATAEAVQLSHKGRGLDRDTLAALETARVVALRFADPD